MEQMSLSPIIWSGGRLRLLDQTRLPAEEVWLEIADVAALAGGGGPPGVGGGGALGGGAGPPRQRHPGA
jgi:hypothetical protein